MCRELLGDAAATKIQSIPLSDDTVARRIVDMSDDIECQLVEWIKASPYFVIQLDESTDISNAALLLVFVRYCMDSNLCEDLLFCKELPTRTAADNVMHCLDEYFTEKGLDWKYCTGICTDGAATMTGKHCGPNPRASARSKVDTRFLAQGKPCNKADVTRLHEVMNIAVKTVNYIRKNALSSTTQGVLQLCVNDLMLIICSSCTTVKYGGFQEDVCLRTHSWLPSLHYLFCWICPLLLIRSTTRSSCQPYWERASQEPHSSGLSLTSQIGPSRYLGEVRYPSRNI